MYYYYFDMLILNNKLIIRVQKYIKNNNEKLITKFF